ncbi:MAG: GlsB/YeaQ/YmgE family stress response membrane protein [Longimicrobiales bacterium]
MGILTWILFGLIAGALAKLILPGKDPGGCLVTILIGIAGALIGGFIGTEVLDFGTVTGFNLRSLGIAILGSVLLLLLYRLLVGRGGRRRPDL